MKLEEKDIQFAMNRRLSALTDDPLRRARIRQRIVQKEEARMTRKFSIGMAVMLAMLLISATALAAGLIFSPKADTQALADKTLEETYGVSQAMLGYFRRTVREQADGTTVVTYEGFENLSYVLGTYTVTVKGNKAAAVWSRDGEDTSGGLDADAWGVEQLAEMLKISTTEHEVKSYFEKANAINAKHELTFENRFQGSAETEEEYAARQAKTEAEIKALQKLSQDEMVNLARQALSHTYGLTEDQIKAMRSEEDMYYYCYKSDRPCLEVFFFLQQKTSGDPAIWPEWTEMDGQYWVAVNVETGVIEEILYDSGLNGNG